MLLAVWIDGIVEIFGACVVANIDYEEDGRKHHNAIATHTRFSGVLVILLLVVVFVLAWRIGHSCNGSLVCVGIGWCLGIFRDVVGGFRAHSWRYVVCRYIVNFRVGILICPYDFQTLWSSRLIPPPRFMIVWFDDLVSFDCNRVAANCFGIPRWPTQS